MTAQTEKLKALALAVPERDFTDDERRLYELMSEISEDCWCAGWMHGNEFSLWDAISTGNLRYGMGEMDRDLLARVAALSVKTGEWIIWLDDQSGLDPQDVSEWGAYSITLKEWADHRASLATAREPELVPVPTTVNMARMMLALSYSYLKENAPEHLAAPAAGTAKDAERYRWLRAKSPDTICAIAWSVPAACHFGEPDEAIDAAIAAHTKSKEGA